MTGDDEDWVIGLLCDGFGSEDIAVKTGLPLEDVRAFIRQLRADGTLDEVYRRDEE